MKKLIATLLAATAAASAAHAQTATPPASRAYLGLGFSVVDHSYSLNGVTVTSHDGYSSNVKAFGGYQVDPIFAVEVGYIDYANAGFNYFAAANNGHGTSDGNAYYIAAKAQFPFHEQFLGYVKLGAERSRRALKEVGFYNQGESQDGLYVSLGVQFNLTPQIGLLAEYERFGKGKDFGARPDAWTFGARYSF